MIQQTVDAILGSYDFGVHYEQPNKQDVKELTDKLLRVLLPEYFKPKYTEKYLNEYLQVTLTEIAISLQKQIDFIDRAEQHEQGETTEQRNSADIVQGFISQLPRVRELLFTDIDAAYEGDPAAYSKSEIVLSYPGLYALTLQRIAHELYLLNVAVIPRMITEYAHSITGIDIHPGATIGKYFFIDHGTGVVIGETTVIGEHVKIYQGVTLGALSTRGGQKLKGEKRHPTIHDYVTIYSGVSILGGETVIGEGVVIGSNTFITKSVPDKTKVSVKNPELLFKNGALPQQEERIDFQQNEFWHYSI
ncbi:MAG: serine acetyltransferase [Bacteroidales bacterium]|jgi:serine O-acetyltransferase|nr:serine acetyltransferase [Bacteroidales bacterium]